MAPFGDLKLNSAESVERFIAGLRPGAEDEHAGLMVGFAGNMPHGEQQPVPAVVVRGIDNPAPAPVLAMTPSFTTQPVLALFANSAG